MNLRVAITSLAAAELNEIIGTIICYIPSVDESIGIVFVPIVGQVIGNGCHDRHEVVFPGFTAGNVGFLRRQPHFDVYFLWHPLLFVNGKNHKYKADQSEKNTAVIKLDTMNQLLLLAYAVQDLAYLSI